ncbi:MAG TPA: macro domain-containing protein [Patescibacteria group bacterium]|nr:macro domain-containing protein [Patescibacteria group bacterium]
MAGPTEIDVWQGEIAELEVDALVVGSSESLFMTGAAAASVKRIGGPEIESAAVAQGPIEPGRAVVTTGGQLAAPYVVHAVAVGHDRRADPDRLRSAVRSALAFCEPLRLHRIAIAPLGTEYGTFRAEEAADLLVAAILETAAPPLESVVVAVAHANEVRAVVEALARHRTSV